MGTTQSTKRNFATEAQAITGVDDIDFITPKAAKAALEKFYPPGAIKSIPSEVVPDGWLECNGQQLNRIDEPDLFAVIGTAFGANDAATFIIPDLRGRFTRGWDNLAGVDEDAENRVAHAPGGAVGDRVGSLQDDTLGEHSHVGNVGDPHATHTHTYAGWYYDDLEFVYMGMSRYQNPTTETSSSEDTDHTHLFTTHQTSELGDENRPKNLYLMYIIKK